MKKLILALALALSWASPIQAATTLAQAPVSGALSGVTTTALAFGSNVTAGSELFMVTVVADGLTPTVSGVSDTLLNTWTVVAAANTTGYRIEVWKAPSPSGGANTVTTTFSGNAANTGSMAIFEFSGMGVTTNGASNTLSISVAEDPLTLATLTATGPGVAFTAVRMINGFTLSSFGDSFVDAGGSTRARVAYRILASGASLAPTMDNSTTEAGESLTTVVYEAVVSSGTKRQLLLGCCQW
jgi:hypothetical protein